MKLPYDGSHGSGFGGGQSGSRLCMHDLCNGYWPQDHHGPTYVIEVLYYQLEVVVMDTIS